MPKLEAALFDLDGTLLDSAHDIAQGVNAMLAEDGRPPLTVDEIKPFLGDGAMELCRRALLKTGGVMADDLYPFVQKFVEHYRRVEPDQKQIFPGVREMLEFLKSRGIKLGICTNKGDAATRSLLASLDLNRYFGFIAGGDTFAVHKPHPGHVIGVLEALEADASNSVFVGDGPRDAQAAKGAGVRCLLVKHGYGENLESLGADAVIEHFGEFAPMLQKLDFVI